MSQAEELAFKTHKISNLLTKMQYEILYQVLVSFVFLKHKKIYLFSLNIISLVSHKEEVHCQKNTWKNLTIDRKIEQEKKAFVLLITLSYYLNSHPFAFLPGTFSCQCLGWCCSSEAEHPQFLKLWAPPLCLGTSSCQCWVVIWSKSLGIPKLLGKGECFCIYSHC